MTIDLRVESLETISDKRVLKNFLQKKNIKASYTRTSILQYLLQNPAKYVTATEIFTSLSEEIFSLSKATIYNTLKIFEDKGIVKSLVFKDRETRYYLNSRQAIAHFKCLVCNQCFPFDLDSVELEEVIKGISNAEFEIEGMQITYTGKCKECSGK